jgi:hypothetical protein
MCNSSSHSELKEGDLSRYIAGNVSLPTVRAVAVEHNDPPGNLSALPNNVNESEIPPQERLPRVTSAIWYHLLIFNSP